MNSNIVNVIKEQIESGEVTFSKTLAQQFAAQIIEQVEDGGRETLNALAQLEFFSQVIEAAKSKIREIATDELDLYGNEAKTGVTKYGVTFKLKESGVRYNYTQTPKFNEIKAKEEEIAEQRKALEDQLKILKSPTTMIEQETGEMIDLFPAIKTSKTTCEISLSK
jgi:hypothetical protein